MTPARAQKRPSSISSEGNSIVATVVVVVVAAAVAVAVQIETSI